MNAPEQRSRPQHLERAAEPFCAGDNDRGIRSIGSGHCRPTALLDHRFCRRIGLMLELLDADRRRHGNHCGLGALLRYSLGGAAQQRPRVTRTIGIIAQSRRALLRSALAGADPALRSSRRRVGSDIAPFLRPRAKFPTERLQRGPRILLGGVVGLPVRPGNRGEGGEPPSTSVQPCPGVRQVRLARPP